MSEYTRYTYDITDYRGNIIEDRKHVILVSDDVLVYMSKELLSGVTKSGKTWSRWADKVRITVSTRARGKGPRRLNYYKETWRPKFGFHNITRNAFRSEISGEVPFEFYSHLGTLIENFTGVYPSEVRNYCEAFPNNLRKDNVSREDVYHLRTLMIHALENIAYPMSVHHPVPDEGIHPGLTYAFRQDNKKDFIKHSFGAKNYRKDLLRTIDSCYINYVGVMAMLKGVVPVDYLIESMNSYTESYERVTLEHSHEKGNSSDTVRRNRNRLFLPLAIAPKNKSQWRKFIAHQTRPAQRKLLTSLPQQHARLVIDTITMFENICQVDSELVASLKSASDWKTIHNEFSKVHRKLKHINRVIEDTKYSRKLQKCLDGIDYTFIPAKGTEDLIDWSSEMGNCISSYSDKAVNGTALLGGVYDREHKLVANVEIDPRTKSLRQFLGRFNSSIPDIYEIIVPAWKKSELISSDSTCWR